jgi:phosphoribosylamine--glycine ligase
MKVLLIGSGGREHALCYAISKSRLLTKLYAAPGNAGMKNMADCIDLKSDNHDDVIAFCKQNNIDLVVIGPEAPLVAGLADDLEKHGILAFGPSAKAAKLEGSKAFTKALCDEAGIPTAAYARFDSLEPALYYVRQHVAPIVIKADGLAAGKGVTVAMTLEEAENALKACFEGAFGAAGAEVVIEEFMEGEEASVFALSDGDTLEVLATAQDHKRVGDGDTGPNTGGMGAYSPAPVMTDAMLSETRETILVPTIETMRKRGTPFKGVLYAGLMLTKEGPKLVEYNVRFGDPECQVLMMRLKSDLLQLMIATCNNALADAALEWDDRVALTVVMASDGYPGSYSKNTEIRGIQEAEKLEDVIIFHAGTAEKDGKLLSTGGRVLNVTALGDTVKDAQSKAYNAVRKIDWPEGFCRKDIGWRAL